MNKKLMVLALSSVLFLSACGSSTPTTPTADINAIYTAAAQTIAAELTQAASVSTPTSEEIATETPAPPAEIASFTDTPAPTLTLTTLSTAVTQANCEDAKWIADVNVPDLSVMAAGQDFIKTWRIKNAGTCPWVTGYGLIYGGYVVKLDGIPAPLTATVNPGEETEVSVQLKAPTKAGEYTSNWRMVNPQGYPFGEFFWAKIVVK